MSCMNSEGRDEKTLTGGMCISPNTDKGGPCDATLSTEKWQYADSIWKDPSNFYVNFHTMWSLTVTQGNGASRGQLLNDRIGVNFCRRVASGQVGSRQMQR